jgi:hypothetical protein
VAREHSDEVHRTIPAHPVGATAIPAEEPNWNYQISGRMFRDQMVTCLVAELKKAAQSVVNFDKLREIQQEKKENPASFSSRLTEALQCHTKLTLKLRMG